jgi:hypothetical protein
VPLAVENGDSEIDLAREKATSWHVARQLGSIIASYY